MGKQMPRRRGYGLSRELLQRQRSTSPLLRILERCPRLCRCEGWQDGLRYRRPSGEQKMSNRKLDAVWAEVADLMGWKWSAAHNGYINENERRGPTWADYVVAPDAREACFLSGVETERDAFAQIEANSQFGVGA